MMQLVEQHIISKSDARYEAIDRAAFAAKNLYNAANYLVRQTFIFQRKYLGYGEVYHQIKHHEAYKALPRKVSKVCSRSERVQCAREFWIMCQVISSPLTSSAVLRGGEPSTTL